VNDVSRLEVASGRDNGIANRATPYTPTLFVNLRSSFAVDCAICARAFVKSPVGSRDNCIGVLVGDVASNKP
jgi:hypothetical protein